MGSEPSRPAGPPAARGAVALCLPLGRCVTPRCGAAHVLAVAAPMAGIGAPHPGRRLPRGPHLRPPYAPAPACLLALAQPVRRYQVSGAPLQGAVGSSGDIARWRAVAEGHPHARMGHAGKRRW